MSRVKAKNPLITRVSIIIFVSLISMLLICFCINIILQSINLQAYDLGEKSVVGQYQDYIIRNYYDYLDLVKKYNIEQRLTIENFESNHYIASFQEYDPCGESKMKDVEKIEIGDKIKITFRVNNKCGWCRAHVALHLIKIDKVNSNKEIIYDYNYAKELDCGTIK